MAESLGRIAVVQVSVDGGSNYNSVGDMKDPVFTTNQDLHDITDNDDGNFKTDLRGHLKATLTFTCNYDETDTAQENMLAAIYAGTACLWKVRPQGTGVGNVEYLFTGNFSSQEINLPTQGPQEFPVSVESSGTVARQDQT